MTIAKSDETATSPALIEEDFEDFWEPPPPPTDLIFDDGEPLESNRHRIAMNVLIRSLQQGYGERGCCRRPVPRRPGSVYSV